MDEVIQTRKIELLDKEGRIRAAIGVDDGEGYRIAGPYIRMFSPSGKTLVKIALEDERAHGGHAPAILLRSEDSVMQIEMGVDTGAGTIRLSNGERGFSIVGENAGEVNIRTHDSMRDEVMEAVDTLDRAEADAGEHLEEPTA